MSYTAEIDNIEPAHWNRLLHEFDDATIFQTWTYGSARWGQNNLSHAVIKKDGCDFCTACGAVGSCG